MRLDISLDKVETGEFDTLPPGSYEIEVTGWKRDVSEAGPYIRWTLKPMGELPEGNFGNLYLKTWLHAEALWNLKRFLKACQFEWDPKGFDTEDVIGCTCEVSVVNDTSEKDKRVYANVTPNYLPLSK